MRARALRWVTATWILCLAAVARAGNPAFSTVAVAVNSHPLVKGPAREITVRPGDVITANLFIRDWSPGGEALRAYQATIDAASYESGETGAVKPVGYDEKLKEKSENRANAFIDADHPQYVFRNLAQIGIAATLSADYRFLAFVVDFDHSVVCPQDGSGYYAGTLRLRASDDASGTFVVRFNEQPHATLMYDPQQNLIGPLAYEPLTVHVTSKVLRVVSAAPPRGSALCRLCTGSDDCDGFARPSPPAGDVVWCGMDAWDRVELIFNDDAASVAPTDFKIDHGGAGAPNVVKVNANGATAVLVLDRPLRPARWTTITHAPSDSGVRLAHLPGDVNHDGRVDAQDLLSLAQQCQNRDTEAAAETEASSKAVKPAQAAARLLDLLVEPDAYRRCLSPRGEPTRADGPPTTP